MGTNFYALLLGLIFFAAFASATENDDTFTSVYKGMTTSNIIGSVPLSNGTYAVLTGYRADKAIILVNPTAASATNYVLTLPDDKSAAVSLTTDGTHLIVLTESGSLVFMNSSAEIAWTYMLNSGEDSQDCFSVHLVEKTVYAGCSNFIAKVTLGDDYGNPTMTKSISPPNNSKFTAAGISSEGVIGFTVLPSDGVITKYGIIADDMTKMTMFDVGKIDAYAGEIIAGDTDGSLVYSAGVGQTQQVVLKYDPKATNQLVYITIDLLATLTNIPTVKSLGNGLYSLANLQIYNVLDLSGDEPVVKYSRWISTKNCQAPSLNGALAMSTSRVLTLGSMYGENDNYLQLMSLTVDGDFSPAHDETSLLQSLPLTFVHDAGVLEKTISGTPSEVSSTNIGLKTAAKATRTTNTMTKLDFSNVTPVTVTKPFPVEFLKLGAQLSVDLKGYFDAGSNEATLKYTSYSEKTYPINDQGVLAGTVPTSLTSATTQITVTATNTSQYDGLICASSKIQVLVNDSKRFTATNTMTMSPYPEQTTALQEMKRGIQGSIFYFGTVESSETVASPSRILDSSTTTTKKSVTGFVGSVFPNLEANWSVNTIDPLKEGEESNFVVAEVGNALDSYVSSTIGPELNGIQTMNELYTTWARYFDDTTPTCQKILVGETETFCLSGTTLRVYKNADGSTMYSYNFKKSAESDHPGQIIEAVMSTEDIYALFLTTPAKTGDESSLILVRIPLNDLSSTYVQSVAKTTTVNSSSLILASDGDYSIAFAILSSDKEATFFESSSDFETVRELKLTFSKETTTLSLDFLDGEFIITTSSSFSILKTDATTFGTVDASYSLSVTSSTCSLVSTLKSGTDSFYVAGMNCSNEETKEPVTGFSFLSTDLSASNADNRFKFEKMEAAAFTAESVTPSWKSVTVADQAPGVTQLNFLEFAAANHENLSTMKPAVNLNTAGIPAAKKLEQKVETSEGKTLHDDNFINLSSLSFGENVGECTFSLAAPSSVATLNPPMPFGSDGWTLELKSSKKQTVDVNLDVLCSNWNYTTLTVTADFENSSGDSSTTLGASVMFYIFSLVFFFVNV